MPSRACTTSTVCEGCGRPLSSWEDCDGDWHWIDHDNSEWCDHPDHDAHQPEWSAA